jgi:hypothetical protein
MAITAGTDDRDARVDGEPVTVELLPSQRCQLSSSRPGYRRQSQSDRRVVLEYSARSSYLGGTEHRTHVLGADPAPRGALAR